MGLLAMEVKVLLHALGATGQNGANALAMASGSEIEASLCLLVEVALHAQAWPASTRVANQIAAGSVWTAASAPGLIGAYAAAPAPEGSGTVPVPSRATRS